MLLKYVYHPAVLQRLREPDRDADVRLHPRLPDNPLHRLRKGAPFRRRGGVPGVDGADALDWQANNFTSYVDW